MTLTLIHTSPAHVPTFKALADRIAPGVALTQIIREDWLKQARKHGLRQSLCDEITETVASAKGAVICTCTTIGPAAEAAGAIRIDGPMMAEAARIGGPILLVYALASTAEPSLALLEQALAKTGKPQTVHPLSLTEFWPLFEAGQHEAFTACVAGGIRHAAEQTNLKCVVIAQASMAGAAPMVADLGIPILTSPELALHAALET